MLRFGATAFREPQSSSMSPAGSTTTTIASDGQTSRICLGKAGAIRSSNCLREDTWSKSRSTLRVTKPVVFSSWRTQLLGNILDCKPLHKRKRLDCDHRTDLRAAHRPTPANSAPDERRFSEPLLTSIG